MTGLRYAALAAAIAFGARAQTKIVHDEPIGAGEIRAHVELLASDRAGGRAPGTYGSVLASGYLKEHARMDPLRFDFYDDGYQTFEIVTGVAAGEQTALVAAGDTLAQDEDYAPLAFSASSALEAEATFVGYGFEIDDGEIEWNDYENADVEGKWAIVLMGAPPVEEGPDPYAEYVDPRMKAVSAAENGAKGVLFVAGPVQDRRGALPALSSQPFSSDAGVLAFQISADAANKLLDGTTVEALEAAANEKKRSEPFDVAVTISGETELTRVTTRARNLVVALEGSDPALKSEWVVLGAHYDHLGKGGPGSGSRRPDTTAIHNGADDNASGVALVAEIGERLAFHQKELKRSVLLVFFDGEERGLLGSKRFVSDPPVPLENVVLMANFDMVGMLDSTGAFEMMGVGTGEGMQALAERLAEERGLKPAFAPEGYGPSDHASFYAENVPVAMFHTGAHERYHTPDDDAEYLNYEGMKRLADFAYDFVREIANRDDRLAFKKAGPKSRPGGRRSFNVTLGIMPDHGADVEGLRAQIVIEDRPAAMAGMQNGDVIVAINGKPVGDIYDYMKRLGELRVGERAMVEVIRDGEKIILPVDL